MSRTNIDFYRLEWVRRSRARYLGWLLQAIGHSLLWPVRVYRSRQVLHRLAAMDPRELRDIGLTIHDVRSAQALPLDIDPTSMLADRAREHARNEIDKRYY
jgi:uncharacterized protein YjiS (DUF1127 family)